MFSWACCLYLRGVHRLVRALYFVYCICILVLWMLFPLPFMHFRREKHCRGRVRRLEYVRIKAPTMCENK